MTSSLETVLTFSFPQFSIQIPTKSFLSLLFTLLHPLYFPFLSLFTFSRLSCINPSQDGFFVMKGTLFYCDSGERLQQAPSKNEKLIDRHRTLKLCKITGETEKGDEKNSLFVHEFQRRRNFSISGRRLNKNMGTQFSSDKVTWKEWK